MRVVIYPDRDDKIENVAKAQIKLQSTLSEITGRHTVDTEWAWQSQSAVDRARQSVSRANEIIHYHQEGPKSRKIN